MFYRICLVRHEFWGFLISCCLAGIIFVAGRRSARRRLTMERHWVIFFVVFTSIHQVNPQLTHRKQKKLTELIVQRSVNNTGNHNGDAIDKTKVSGKRSKHSRMYAVVEENWEEEVKQKAMEELLNIFDLPRPEPSAKNNERKMKRPPKYMVDLYKTIADQHGVARSPQMLQVDIVRSIPNTGNSCPTHCFFNAGLFRAKEILMDAELHVYIQKPKIRKDIRWTTSYFIKIYQSLEENKGQTKLRRVVVAARRLPMHVYGWQIFPLLTTVEHWRNNPRKNLGISIEKICNKNFHLFRSRFGWNQPMLVVFSNSTDVSGLQEPTGITSSYQQTEVLHASSQWSSAFFTSSDERNKRSVPERTTKKFQLNQIAAQKLNKSNKHRNFTAGKIPLPNSPKKSRNHNPIWSSSATFNPVYSTEIQHDESETSLTSSFTSSAYSRQQRASSARFSSFSVLSTTESSSCRRYPLYVDFEKMGWSGWIIHPQGYNAYHCRGKCMFPLNRNFNPSNHATVQSIMHTLGLGDQQVDMPCCVPNKSYDINLLYFDANDYVVLRRYKDMVVASCACR